MASQNVLYLIQEEDSDWIKVGISKNLVSRLTDHQCGNPRMLSIMKVHTFPTMFYATLIEKVLLKHLHRKEFVEKQRSEWFLVNDKDEFIKYVSFVVNSFFAHIENFNIEMDMN
jgi:predicted GIY-YIG superfamily endonuclease